MNTNLEPVPSAHYLSLYMRTSAHKALATGNDHRKLLTKELQEETNKAPRKRIFLPTQTTSKCEEGNNIN